MTKVHTTNDHVVGLGTNVMLLTLVFGVTGIYPSAVLL
jgi:hypothetical protein